MGMRGRAWDDFRGRGMSKVQKAAGMQSSAGFTRLTILHPHPNSLQTPISKSPLPPMGPATL